MSRLPIYDHYRPDRLSETNLKIKQTSHQTSRLILSIITLLSIITRCTSSPTRSHSHIPAPQGGCFDGPDQFLLQGEQLRSTIHTLVTRICRSHGLSNEADDEECSYEAEKTAPTKGLSFSIAFSCFKSGIQHQKQMPRKMMWQ